MLTVLALPIIIIRTSVLYAFLSNPSGSTTLFVDYWNAYVLVETKKLKQKNSVRLADKPTGIAFE